MRVSQTTVVLVLLVHQLIPEASQAFLSPLPLSCRPFTSRPAFAQCRPRGSFGDGLQNSRPRFPLYAETASEESVDVGDLESLQALFSKYCDNDGLMTKASVMKIPPIVELLRDLTTEEFNEIWKKAPKFPDEQEDRIDVDSFVQIYRDIDDLFEEEEDEEVPQPEASDSDEGDDEDGMLEGELASIFASICDKDELLSKDNLQAWDEVAKLLDEGLLGEDEFDVLWEKTKKTPGAAEKVDLDGFLSFNVALDGLFEFEEEELEAEEQEAEEPGPAASNVADEVTDTGVVVEGDRSPAELFAALANQDGIVGTPELNRWSELQDMLQDGDLAQSEVDTIFSAVSKAPQLDEAAFLDFYAKIDELFEEVDDEIDEANGSKLEASLTNENAPAPSVSAAERLKEELLEMIDDINGDEEKLPCGLEASELEQRRILAVVEELEREPANLLRQKQGGVELADLDGTWELLYSSSSAMKFNKGLSGIGGSFPNGRFAGLKQKLVSSKYLTDVEYTERVEVNPSSASFDVTVTGFWELRQSTSLFTGEPSTVLIIEPDRVTYGPTSTRADHWKSLGPMNLLDVSYLDDDLRVMRGNTSIDTVFILRRC